MVNITIYPPVSQDIFFQEVQFDPRLGRGTDPEHYEKFGSKETSKEEQKPLRGNTSEAREIRQKRLEKELEGHENKDAILRILRAGC